MKGWGRTRCSFVLLVGLCIVAVSGCVTYDSLMPPLFQASQKGDFQAFKTLQMGGESIHQTGVMDQTVLHFAVGSGNLELVKHIVEGGLDVNVKDANGATPLHVAAYNGHLEIVQYLGEKGARFGDKTVVTQTPRGKKVDCTSIRPTAYRKCGLHGQTPAHYAVLGGVRGELSQKLIKRFLGDQYKESMNIYGHVAVLDFLFSKGADVNSKDGFGRTLIFYPVILGEPDMLKYLILEGGDVNIPDNQGMSAMDWLDRPTNIISEEQYTQSALLTRHGGKSMDMQGVREIVSQYASVAPSDGASGMPHSASNVAIMANVPGTVVECAKLFAAVKVCEQMPFPLSTGCEKVARAKLNKIICQAVPM